MEETILSTFESFQQAMIDKDIELMNSLVTPDITFTHMSGKKQTKEEFFKEIENNTLNYYDYTIQNPVVKVTGNKAVLIADTTLRANVYGISGIWTLPTKAHFIKIDGKWFFCN